MHLSSEVKPEVNLQTQPKRSHFTIDLYYRIIVFAFFGLSHVADQANFQITKVEAQKEYFEQKIAVALVSYCCESRFARSIEGVNSANILLG